jgi:hypothetical protein
VARRGEGTDFILRTAFVLMAIVLIYVVIVRNLRGKIAAADTTTG